MKKKLAILIAAMISFGLTACGGSSASTGNNASAPASESASAEEAPTEEAAADGAITISDTHYDLTLGTAATTGTYYVVGAAIANEVDKSNDNLTVVAQATNGGVENVNLCMSGEMELGFTNSDAAYWASNGGGTSFYETYANAGDIKGVMKLYESEGHMITMAKSSIETYEDLKGKTVCLGPPSSTIPAMSISILEAYGIDPEKDITPVYYSISEGLEKLTDGVIDATFFVASAPASGLTSAAATSELKFVDADPEILAKVVENYPYYVVSSTKVGAYPTLNSVNTLKIYTEIIASGQVPDEAIYQFVKGAIEGHPNYVDAHVACREIVAETAYQTSAELHPGAAAYYRELGLIE